jgi:dTDP-4-amino-4,6-dideoxygalactose transaminase
MQTMLDRGVATRRGVMCSHLERAYSETPAPALPQSEAAHRRCILLPLYPQMTDQDQRVVAEALEAALDAGHSSPVALPQVA